MSAFIVDDSQANLNNVANFEAEVSRVILNSSKVAFDCEGVNLCRAGTLEIVSLCFDNGANNYGYGAPKRDVYLVDLSGKSAGSSDRIVYALRRLFEANNATKVIHDCKMDCDALHHLFGIRLINVHDTSCFHRVIYGQEDKNLNDVLSYNGISTNVVRDKNVYNRDPAFWARRPMTQQMVLCLPKQRGSRRSTQRWLLA
jgi:DNA polymerase I-like protein with 3'-5' exonuclease and polymerase domains